MVDRATADGSQVWHRSSDPSGPPNDTAWRFGADGVYLTRETLRFGQAGATTTFTCDFGSGIASPPWPVRVGATYGGHGDCGNFTVEVSGHIDSQRQVTIDGSTFDVYVMTTKAVTHGQVESTLTEVDWYSPALRLPVHQEQSASGTYGFVSFESQMTSDLESARPA